MGAVYRACRTSLLRQFMSNADSFSSCRRPSLNGMSILTILGTLCEVPYVLAASFNPSLISPLKAVHNNCRPAPIIVHEDAFLCRK